MAMTQQERDQLIALSKQVRQAAQSDSLRAAMMIARTLDYDTRPDTPLVALIVNAIEGGREAGKAEAGRRELTDTEHKFGRDY